MTKGQFALLTAALGLATMAGAGYFGYAHADSPSSTGSGSSGSALGVQGQSGGTGTGGTPAGGAPTAAAGGTGNGTGGGTGSVTAGGSPAGVPECTGTDIQVTETDGEGAAGTLSVVIDFTDTSGHACYLHGYPGASMLDQDGKPVLNATRTMVGQAGGASGYSTPPRVVLKAGATATAVVEWSDVAGSQSCTTPVSLGVTPPNTKQTTDFSMSGPVCSGFEVHPVVPAQGGVG